MYFLISDDVVIFDSEWVTVTEGSSQAQKQWEFCFQAQINKPYKEKHRFTFGVLSWYIITRPPVHDKVNIRFLACSFRAILEKHVEVDEECRNSCFREIWTPVVASSVKASWSNPATIFFCVTDPYCNKKLGHLGSHLRPSRWAILEKIMQKEIDSLFEVLPGM